VKVQPGYQNFYIYSGVSPHSGDSFSLFLPEPNTDMMNLFLTEFSQFYPGQEILLLLDQARWHTARELQVPPHITLEYLPPYSPELNPVEKLWQWLRQEVTHNQIFPTLHALMDALQSELRKLTPQDFQRLCHCSYL
jgi:transposase